MSEILKNRFIPPGLASVRKTPSFTQASVPKSLLNEHRTNIWAQLVVEQGTIIFSEPPNKIHSSLETRSLESGDVQIIEPEVLHYVQVSDDAVFHVEFFDVPTPIELKGPNRE